MTSCRVIPDLYEELLALEEAGDLVIHRWEDMSQEKLAQIRRVILREIEQDGGVPDGPPNPYILFIRRHFPNLV